MTQLQFELLPALLGLCTYAVYTLVNRLGKPKSKHENGRKVSSDFDDVNSKVKCDAHPCTEPDQEPSPLTEVSATEHVVVRAPIYAAVAILFVVAIAVAGSAFQLQWSAQWENVNGRIASKGIRMIERYQRSQQNEAANHAALASGSAAMPLRDAAGQLHDNVLSVKLTKQRVENEQEEEDFVRSAYYGTLMIGSPPEPFTVVFDTGSGHLVLPSTYCRSDTCRIHKRYRRSSSTTGRDINHDGVLVDPGKVRDQISVSFGTGEVTGVFVEDVVCIDQVQGQVAASNNTNCSTPGICERGEEESPELPKGCVPLRFIAATELSEDPFKDFQFDGILGLGLDGLSQSPEFNFVEVVAKSVGAWGSSAPHTFGVFLGNNAVEDSEIALGGWAAKHLTEDLAWSPVPDPEMGHWLVNVRSIRAGNEKLPFCADGTCKAAVDTGTSLLAVPTTLFPELYELLRHPAPLAGHCTGAGRLLHFELDEFTITLGPRDYARAEKTGYGNPRPAFGKAKSSPRYRRDLRCNPMLMTLDLPEPLGPKLFILGEPVLRKYYTAYDGKGKRIGFGRARHLDVPKRDELFVKAGLEGHSTRAPTMFDIFRWRKSYR